jgi:endonuclease YncB( thermonuclease family)
MKLFRQKSFIFILIAVALAVFTYYNKQKEEAETANIPINSMKVVAVGDGDTFTGLTSDNEQVKVRIYAIDAPESKQPFGTKSKQYLSNLIFGKTVEIKVQSQDRYGRTVAWVYTPDGKDVAAEMLRAGMAWHYKHYNKSAEYAQFEQEARKAKHGLWADENPVAPWNFKKQ